MKVWYVCRSRITRDYDVSEYFILFSTQEKEVEKFMGLVESESVVWVLKTLTIKYFLHVILEMWRDMNVII